MIAKKGLSDIVTNVLIILLVLVAVGIIWLFLRPTVSSVGQVQGSTECLTIDIQPVSCSGGSVVMKRNPGTGNLKGVVIVLTNPTTQATEPVTLNEPQITPLKSELGTMSYDLSSEGVDPSGKRITVAPIVSGSEGTKTCAPSTVSVLCP